MDGTISVRAGIVSSRHSFAYLAPALTGNLLILALFAFAGGLALLAPEHYYGAVQEDGHLEWASFWAFALAAGAFATAATRHWRAVHRFPWFALCVGGFCALVALEEISWGQRLLGFRPPSFFLGHNFQQELNFHNVIASGLRKLGVELVIVTYGLLLPVAMRARAIGPWLARRGAIAPPLWSMPAFAMTLVVYLWYPWDFTGEWVELALGLGFLFSAQENSQRYDSRRRLHAARPALRIAAVWLIAVALGAATTAVQSARASSDPARIEAARTELNALSVDLASLVAGSECGAHKRLYTLMRERRWDTLGSGRFAELVTRGVPTARIQYLLDPWNSPYWVRDLCADAADGNRLVLLYSFGPNRRRDSTERAIAGDDLGIVLENPRHDR